MGRRPPATCTPRRPKVESRWRPPAPPAPGAPRPPGRARSGDGSEHDHLREAGPVDLVGVAAPAANACVGDPRPAAAGNPWRAPPGVEQLELVVGNGTRAEADRVTAQHRAADEQRSRVGRRHRPRHFSDRPLAAAAAPNPEARRRLARERWLRMDGDRTWTAVLGWEFERAAKRSRDGSGARSLAALVAAVAGGLSQSRRGAGQTLCAVLATAVAVVRAARGAG